MFGEQCELCCAVVLVPVPELACMCGLWVTLLVPVPEFTFMSRSARMLAFVPACMFTVGLPDDPSDPY